MAYQKWNPPIVMCFNGAAVRRRRRAHIPGPPRVRATLASTVPPSGDDGEGGGQKTRTVSHCALQRCSRQETTESRRSHGRRDDLRDAASTVPPSGDDGELGEADEAEEEVQLQRCRRQETTESNVADAYAKVRIVLQRCRRQETTERPPGAGPRAPVPSLASTVPPSGDDGEATRERRRASL